MTLKVGINGFGRIGRMTLRSVIEKIKEDISCKFDKQNDLNQKIDELNQETEILIDEIDKWET